jgi:integrase
VSSAWIEKRATGSGTRYRVKYRVGGRESKALYGGTFRTMKEAKQRRDWINGELSSMRVPNVKALAAPAAAPTVRVMAERWLASRVDIAENTMKAHRSSVSNLLPLIGNRSVDTITPADVAGVIAELSKTRKRETVRKALGALAMTLDFADVKPNPAKDRVHVKLPRENKEPVNPPIAEHVSEVHRLLPARYRLPLLVLDATGMRLGELEGLTWGDVDEQRGRWRVTAAVAKTSKARWVSVPPPVFDAVTALVPRDDRTPARRVFQGFDGDSFRTAISRACTAAGVPSFSPHDLRHRRISLLHLGGVPWARIGEHVGQSNLAVTANTYSHVLSDEAELDYEGMLS